MKKIKFLILFVLVVTIGGLYAQDSFSEGDFEYTIENGNATIVEYTGQTRGAYGYVEYENLIIPEKLGGYKVTHIENYAFLDCYSLTTIEIPDSVTSMGDSAFSGCSSLASLEIPNSVTSIGNSAFAWCKSLTTIKIPDSVTSIGVDVFRGCDNLILTLTNGSYAHKYALERGINFVLE